MRTKPLRTWGIPLRILHARLRVLPPPNPPQRLVAAHLEPRALPTCSPGYADAPPVVLLARSALDRVWDGAGFFLRRWHVRHFDDDVVVVARYDLARALSIRIR